eukprot:m.83845 g.83845  ORF g.83845 m.83845 type:complete len:957 (-) comp12136_c0_seq1:91-2961(-)
MPGLTSVGGVLALLEEEENDLKVFAITKLLGLVDTFWAEIANDITKIEELFEDETFSHRFHAALLASHVFYNLGEMDDALQFALNAGDAFDITRDNLYTHTITGRALDTYTEQRQKNAEVDGALEGIANRLFQQCLDDGTYEQLIGLSLECHRLDLIHSAIQEADDKAALISYCFKMTVSFVSNRTFRDSVLEMLSDLYSSDDEINYFNLYQCLIATNNANAIASSLVTLLENGEELLATQLAFVLEEMVSQQLLKALVDGLIVKEIEIEGLDTSRIRSIISGDVTLPLYVNFLSKNNRTDMLLLNQTKKDLGTNSSMQDSAMVIAHALAQCGTTNDTFLRENEDMLSHFTNYAKFTAVSGLGVVHKGHLSAAQSVLQPYLPTEDNNNVYENGGALFALGLIYANAGQSQVDYLISQLTSSLEETVRHGAALGLGLAAMGSARNDVYAALKDVLFSDNAIAGDACGVALGLNMLGSIDDDVFDEMNNYAIDTKHEKTIRGLAIGMALMLFERLEQADSYIDRLIEDKDPILRSSGCHGIAMAYAGTNNPSVIKRLLHIAVSDANDDVRRSAATGLGFLFVRDPEKLPSVLSLLCESFNPHVRAGCLMALGIACSGTGNTDAIDLIEPMFKDHIRYVRQAAYVAMALVLVQQPNSHPRIAAFRKKLQEAIKDKHEISMVRFGATMAQSILEAGGRNVTVQLVREGGQLNGPALAGMLVFTQFWFWFPFSFFLSLAFTPTALIFLNGKLEMPELKFVSNAPPSTYAYPKMMEPPKEKERGKVEKAVLSISNKKTRRTLSSIGDFELEKKKEEEEKKEKEKKTKKEEGEDDDDDDEDEEMGDNDVIAEDESAMDTSEDNDGKKKDKKKRRKKKKEEEKFEMLSNPARVVKEQLKVISIPEESRYKPVAEMHGRVIVLRDTTPEEKETIIQVSKIEASSITAGSEVDPPPPFTFNPEVDE